MDAKVRMKINLFLMLVAILEISILINSVPAQSYQIKEADNQKTQEIENKQTHLVKNILLSLFTIKGIGIVSAVSFNTS
jgi:cell division protein FtsL